MKYICAPFLAFVSEKVLKLCLFILRMRFLRINHCVSADEKKKKIESEILL